MKKIRFKIKKQKKLPSKSEIKTHNIILIFGLFGIPLLSLLFMLTHPGSLLEMALGAGVIVFIALAGCSYWSLWRAGDIVIGRQ